MTKLDQQRSKNPILKSFQKIRNRWLFFYPPLKLKLFGSIELITIDSIDSVLIATMILFTTVRHLVLCYRTTKDCLWRPQPSAGSSIIKAIVSKLDTVHGRGAKSPKINVLCTDHSIQTSYFHHFLSGLTPRTSDRGFPRFQKSAKKLIQNWSWTDRYYS